MGILTEPTSPLRIAPPVAAALVAGALLGILEGSTYPPTGNPRLHLAAYWATLTFALILATTALLSLAKHPRAFTTALCALPIAHVAQDAASLLLQGHTPSTATWYATMFGTHPLTTTWLDLAPGWYFTNTLLSLLLLLTPPAPLDQPADKEAAPHA